MTTPPASTYRPGVSFTMTHMASLSFPFRVDPISRDVVTNPDGSDPETHEAIAAHIMTQPFERPMRPNFGTESVAFGTGLDRGALQLQISEHGWEHITITDVASDTPNGGRIESVVTWERN